MVEGGVWGWGGMGRDEEGRDGMGRDWVEEEG